MNTPLRRTLISLLLLLAGLAGMFLLDRDHRLEFRRENEHELAEAASGAQEALAEALDDMVQTTEHLRAFLLASPRTLDDGAFRQFAAGLLQGEPALRGIYYVNGDMGVEYAVSRPEDQEVMGAELDALPDLAQGARQARQEGRTVITRSTPEQGGQSIVIHAPLYRRERFDGLASTIIDLDPWLREAARSAAGEFQLQFADEDGEVLWGAQRLQGPTRGEIVVVGDGRLQVVAAWRDEPPSLPAVFVVLVWGLGSALTLGAIVAVHRTWGRTHWLSQAVEERTSELRRRESGLRQSVARAEALVRTAARINDRMDSRAVLDAVCEEAARVLDVPAAAILRLNEEEKRFTVAAQAGLPPGFSLETASVPLSTFRQIVDQTANPTVLPDLQAVPDAQVREIATTYEFRTVALAELVYRQRRIGLLCVISVGCQREFDEEDLGLLQGLADQAAQAIANADLFRVTRQLLQQTRRQSQQMQRIMDAVPEGVVLLNARGRILLANPTGSEFLSLLAGVGVGDRVQQLGGESFSDLLQATGRDRPWIELRHGSDERVFEMTDRPLEEGAGAGGRVLLIREVTEERRRQQHMQDRERLATVGQLAAGIAHDFNNIMAIITLYSQTLARNPEFPRWREYLMTMSEQAGHAADLITQLLDFSRRAVMERARMDLLPFIKEVVKLLNRTLSENVLIELQASPGPYVVRADPARLQQALMNLALNARDAMPEGGRLSVSLSRMTVQPGQPAPMPEMAPGEWMCLSVADRGRGIDPEHLPHLFEPFFTTKRAGQGSGLGLSQVYGIVKQHGGEIDVDSVPGQGTNVTIYLPALEEEASASPDTNESQPLPRTGQETILLVEDHDATRQAVHDTLEIMGYEVLVAESGREALELFDQHKKSVDLVLSDMIMPQMGGLALYRALQERFGWVKMVVMTGYPLEDEGRSLLEQGIVEWLHKPFTPNALNEKLRRVLEGEEVSLAR